LIYDETDGTIPCLSCGEFVYLWYLITIADKCPACGKRIEVKDELDSKDCLPASRVYSGDNDTHD